MGTILEIDFEVPRIGLDSLSKIEANIITERYLTLEEKDWHRLVRLECCTVTTDSEQGFNIQSGMRPMRTEPSLRYKPRG